MRRIAGDELEVKGFDDLVVRLIVHLRLFGLNYACSFACQLNIIRDNLRAMCFELQDTRLILTRNSVWER